MSFEQHFPDASAENDARASPLEVTANFFYGTLLSAFELKYLWRKRIPPRIVLLGRGRIPMGFLPQRSW